LKEKELVILFTLSASIPLSQSSLTASQPSLPTLLPCLPILPQWLPTLPPCIPIQSGIAAQLLFVLDMVCRGSENRGMTIRQRQREEEIEKEKVAEGLWTLTLS
jgi:hypothetical protein